MLHFVHDFEFLGLAKKNFTDDYGNEMSQLYYIYKCKKCHKIKIKEFMVSKSDESDGIPTVLDLYRNALDCDVIKAIEIS